MPIYEYEHQTDGPCPKGRCFELSQALYSAPFTVCPECGQPVKKLVSLVGVRTPKTNSDLKSLGFTKLVRRDHGVYENVTATGQESRVWDVRRPETMPNLKGKIRD